MKREIIKLLVLLTLTSCASLPYGPIVMWPQASGEDVLRICSDFSGAEKIASSYGCMIPLMGKARIVYDDSLGSRLKQEIIDHEIAHAYGWKH